METEELIIADDMPAQPQRGLGNPSELGAPTWASSGDGASLTQKATLSAS